LHIARKSNLRYEGRNQEIKESSLKYEHMILKKSSLTGPYQNQIFYQQPCHLQDTNLTPLQNLFFMFVVYFESINFPMIRDTINR
jgi:hypothetical protein